MAHARVLITVLVAQAGMVLWTATPLNVLRWVTVRAMVHVLVLILAAAKQDGMVRLIVIRLSVFR